MVPEYSVVPDGPNKYKILRGDEDGEPFSGSPREVTVKLVYFFAAHAYRDIGHDFLIRTSIAAHHMVNKIIQDHSVLPIDEFVYAAGYGIRPHEIMMGVRWGDLREVGGGAICSVMDCSKTHDLFKDLEMSSWEDVGVIVGRGSPPTRSREKPRKPSRGYL